MPRLHIMTFNVENLLVRFDFKGSDQGLASLLDVDSEIDRAKPDPDSLERHQRRK